MNFAVNITSLGKKFPAGMTVPPLLKSLGKWLSTVPDGSLGYFETLGGGKFSDDGLSKETNKKIREATGIFMQFGDGSELALWKHGDGPPAVVLIDSEGQHRTVAPTFEAFLVAWSKQETDTQLDGLYVEDDLPPQRHEELAAWLRANDVQVVKAKAPKFGKWVERLAKDDAPPKPDRLPAPPPDMAPRVIAALGKPPSDPALAALLSELGIELKNYKTADAQRFLFVPQHGYSLSFEKKVLNEVSFMNEGYEEWDGSVFAAFPHEVIRGVKTTDKIAAARKKLGKTSDEDPPAGLFYYDFDGGTKALLKGYDEDDDDGLPKDAIRYINF